MSDDKAKVLERVRALIAKADSTQYPEEADAFRAKADALMLRYSISQFELKDPDQQNRAIADRPVNLDWYSTNPHHQELWSIMLSCANHCRVALVSWKYTGASIPGVGTEADLDYFDMLFTNIMLEMSKGLEPKPDKDKPLIENLVRMKEAGMKWERCAELLWSIGQLPQFDEPPTRADVHKLNWSALYTKYCADNDRPRLRVSPKVYQRSFAQGFAAEIRERLFNIRKESERQYGANADRDSRSTEIVLADIKSAVDARARQLHGNPPRSRGVRARAQGRIDTGAFGAGREAARNVNLGNRGVSTTHKELNR